MIVLLRLLIIWKPMLVFSIQARKTKICTAVIWFISLFLNLLPFLSSIGYDENTKENKDNWSKDGLEISYETKDALFISYNSGQLRSFTSIGSDYYCLYHKDNF